MWPPDTSRWPRVLVTGAGGPAAIAVIRALQAAGVRVAAADADPTATGLFLVPAEHRHVIPLASDPRLTDEVLSACRRSRATVLLPTVDAELVPLARRSDEIRRAGVDPMLPTASALEAALDKATLATVPMPGVRIPATSVLDADAAARFEYPAIVKPRHGSGSRGVVTVDGAEEARSLAESRGDLLIQELLPGSEYTVDVLVSRAGELLGAVPRERLRIDSGVAVAARVRKSPELEVAAGAVMRSLGLTGLCNVQFKESPSGEPSLLEVNPRPAGTLPLTIAAGVDMPLMALADALGESVQPAPHYEEVAMVRFLENVVIGIEELHSARGEVMA